MYSSFETINILFFISIILFIYIFFGFAGSSLLCRLFCCWGEGGLVCSCSVWDSHCGGFSCSRT